MRALAAAVAATFAATAIAGGWPGRAHADEWTPQWSARLALGGGARFPEGQGTDGLFEMALRSELLFGAAGEGHARIGPALDLRTADFDTIEAVGGAGLLLPTWPGYPIVLTAMAGWAERRGPDRPIFAGTFAWGYRGYDYHDSYGLGLQAYASGRVDLDEPRAWEITFGVEIDLELLVVVPIGFLSMLFEKGDPDEPQD